MPNGMKLVFPQAPLFFHAIRCQPSLPVSCLGRSAVDIAFRTSGGDQWWNHGNSFVQRALPFPQGIVYGRVNARVLVQKCLSPLPRPDNARGGHGKVVCFDDVVAIDLVQRGINFVLLCSKIHHIPVWVVIRHPGQGLLQPPQSPLGNGHVILDHHGIVIAAGKEQVDALQVAVIAAYLSSSQGCPYTQWQPLRHSP